MQEFLPYIAACNIHQPSVSCYYAETVLTAMASKFAGSGNKDFII